MHATVIIRAYRKALEDCIDIMKTKASIAVDIQNREEMLRVVKSSCLFEPLHPCSDGA